MKATAEQDTGDIQYTKPDMAKKDRKFDDERFFCIYYHDLECPVQKRLKEFSLIDSLQPLKDDDNNVLAKAMKGFMKASTFRLTALASFCSSCPHMRKRAYQPTETEKIHEAIMLRAKPVPLRAGVLRLNNE